MRSRTTCKGRPSFRLAPAILAAAVFAILGLQNASAAPPAPPAPPASSPRQDSLLTSGWRFLQQDAENAQEPGFDDGKWAAVRVPHCWNVQSGQNGDWANFYQGPGWYRLHVKPDASAAGKSLLSKFDAAFHEADVFLNGKPVGSHVGGFSAFCFDVTGSMRPGEDNLLAVRLRYRPLTPSTPLGGDYTKFPGLYRDVHLLVLEPVSISPLDEGSSGVRLKQAQVTDAAARVEVTTKLRNATDRAKSVTVRCRVLDADGAQVQSTSVEQSIPAAGAADAVQSLTVTQPHLWNGRADPYLYRAEIEVADGPTVLDRVAQPLGLRYFRADPERGFFLNGKPYALHGVNRHQDRWDKGWAISRADMDEDVSLLLEMGCTGLRLAHYPHSDTFYELCDKAGLIVWTEIPLTGGAWVPKPGEGAAGTGGAAKEAPAGPGAENFMDNARRQLREMIKQEGNHPCIVFWGLWNEIGGRKGEAENDFLKGLVALAKELDPTRLTTAANADEKNKITDVVGRNSYPGWYRGKPDDWKADLSQMLSKNLGKPLIISEYGAGASVLQHQVHPTGVTPKGPFHPEEYQAVIHEDAWKVFHATPSLTATFAWVGMDLASIVRDEGDHPGRNDKGLITADRKVRKDAFYFYKANWNPEPMVHITSQHFTPHPSGAFPVKVYSSCPEVELRVNGQSQGVRKDGESGVFVWTDVNFPEGEMRVEATAGRDGRVVKDACVWTCSPSASPRLDLSGRSRQNP